MKDNIIQLTDNQLIIGKGIVELLQASPKDRISIEYSEKDGEIVPIIVKADCGNVLSKKGTVSFRGKVNDTLSSYGTSFEVEQKDGLFYLKGNNPKYKVFTDVKKAVEHVDINIIKDNHFDIKLDSYEF